MADTVRDIPEQKLLSAGHSGISHNQDINGFAFSGADDGRCRITVDDGEGMTALSGDLLHKMSQFVIGGSGPCLLGCAEFGGGGVLRKDDLYDKQLCAVAVGELSGPPDGMIRRFGSVRPDHHASYSAVLRTIFHNPCRPSRR